MCLFFENMTYSLAGLGLVYVIDVDEHGFETLEILLFLECFQNHYTLFPELEPKKFGKTMVAYFVLLNYSCNK